MREWNREHERFVWSRKHVEEIHGDRFTYKDQDKKQIFFNYKFECSDDHLLVWLDKRSKKWGYKRYKRGQSKPTEEAHLLCLDDLEKRGPILTDIQLEASNCWKFMTPGDQYIFRYRAFRDARNYTYPSSDWVTSSEFYGRYGDFESDDGSFARHLLDKTLGAAAGFILFPLYWVIGIATGVVKLVKGLLRGEAWQKNLLKHLLEFIFTAIPVLPVIMNTLEGWDRGIRKIFSRGLMTAGASDEDFEFFSQTWNKTPQGWILFALNRLLGIALNLAVGLVVYPVFSMMDWVRQSVERMQGLKGESIPGRILGALMLALTPFAYVASVLMTIPRAILVGARGGLAGLLKFHWLSVSKPLDMPDSKGYGDAVQFNTVHAAIVGLVLGAFAMALFSIALTGITVGIPVLGPAFAAIASVGHWVISLFPFINSTAAPAVLAFDLAILTTLATYAVEIGARVVGLLSFGVGYVSSLVNESASKVTRQNTDTLDALTNPNRANATMAEATDLYDLMVKPTAEAIAEKAGSCMACCHKSPVGARSVSKDDNGVTTPTIDSVQQQG